MTELKNRSELVFLYDVKWGNPNGDPLDENKPRYDDERGTILVTDVRLKRTIRDYLASAYNEALWVSGDPVTPTKRCQQLDIKSKEEAIKKCIDVRLFGAVIPTKGEGASETSLTGPVQFRFGRSLNKTKPVYMQGTAAFASGEKEKQRSFRDDYVVPYALIAFYGIINQNAAKWTHMSVDDQKKLIEAIWTGTKDLITRSKMEQIPRLLVHVVYKDGNFHIGELDTYISIKSEKPDENIRGIEELQIDLAELSSVITKRKDYIDHISYRYDDRIATSIDPFLSTLREAGVRCNAL